MIGAIVICGLIPLIITLIIGWISDMDSEDKFLLWAGIGFFVLIIYLLIDTAVACGTGLDYTVTAKYEQKQYNISGLENKTLQEFELDGTYRKTFFLGYGNIHAETNTEMNYYYFKENQYGKKLESIPCNDVYVREVENQESCLIYVVEEREFKGYPVLSKIFFGINDIDYKEGQVIEKILQVPVGTIQIEYNVEI